MLEQTEKAGAAGTSPETPAPAEPLSCPFCGAVGTVEGDDPAWFVGCRTPDCRGEITEAAPWVARSDAIASWNTRHSPSRREAALQPGQWAICSRGRIGKIEGRKMLPWGESWVGTCLDGTPWASRKPALVCDADAALLAAAVQGAADSRRLDWLEQRIPAMGAYVHVARGEKKRIHVDAGWGERPMKNLGRGASLRAAIDTAMPEDTRNG